MLYGVVGRALALRQTILCRFPISEGFSVGSGVSEVLGAFVTTLATVYGAPAPPPELANISFRLIPRPRVAVPELYRRLVLLRIVLFQPE